MRRRVGTSRLRGRQTGPRARHHRGVSLRLVTTTVATRDDALALARAMVERRLAACAQITAIESVYRWQGALQQELEFRILFKTTAAAWPALAAALREQHPYELPAIVAVAAAGADEDFARWVADETAG